MTVISVSPARALQRFFFINYWLVVALLLFIGRDVLAQGAQWFYFAAALGYGAVYLLPLWGISRALMAVPKLSLVSQGLASLLLAALLFLLYLDGFIYHLYGFHFNGFVWNLVTTPGGIESMGGSDGTVYVVWAVGLALVALQFGLAWFARWSLTVGVGNALPRARWALLVVLALMLAERGAYGVSHFTAYRPVLMAAQTVPFYMPTTFRGFAKKMGLEPGRATTLSAEGKGRLHYPLHPLTSAADAKDLNIVWLACESLRFDMLTPEIMPNLWRHAQQGQRFTQHISGGNGTRMGIFSMFYGLPGSYWFSILDERRPPVLVQELQRRNYQFGLYTSAKFTYPEFDKTVWSSIPRERLHQEEGGQGWERDRRNVDHIIDFIEQRDTARPFMSFMFFESAHARYYFPPESVIREDYLPDFNYATVDLEANMPQIFNRYINATHHLDSQIGRVLDELEQQGLLESTLIIVTGDHGEEFMEHGRWGHNSEFHHEQIATPLVLLGAGLTAKVVDAPTSHLDLPATVLSMLGVTNPATDYSLGINLLEPAAQRYRLAASWDALGYVGPEFKVAMPLQAGGLFEMATSTVDDEPVADEQALMQQLQPQLMKVLKDMSVFYRK